MGVSDRLLLGWVIPPPPAPAQASADGSRARAKDLQDGLADRVSVARRVLPPIPPPLPSLGVLHDELLGYGVWLREGEKGSIANMQRMLFDTTYSFMKLPRGICLPFIANMTAYIPQVNPLISPPLLQSPALWVNPPQWAHVLGVSAQTSHIRDDSAPNASRTNHIKSHDYVL